PGGAPSARRCRARPAGAGSRRRAARAGRRRSSRTAERTAGRTPRESGEGPGVSPRPLAAGLAAAALLLDAAGVHSLGALAVVAAVPASGIAALYALDDAIARPCLSRSVLVALA